MHARRPPGPWDRRNVSELAQATFRTALRGYDRDEVRATLDSVAADYRVLQLQNASMRRQIANLEGVLHAYHHQESPVAGAALTVKQQSDHVLERANDEARAILKRAQAQAEEIMTRVWARARQAERPSEQLEHDRNTFRTLLSATISDLLTALTYTRGDSKEDGNTRQRLANDMLADSMASRPAVNGERGQPSPSDGGSSPAIRKVRNHADQHEHGANRGVQLVAEASPLKTADTVEPFEAILKGIDVALVKIPALPWE